MTRWWGRPLPPAALPAGIAVLAVTELTWSRHPGWGWGVLIYVAACVLLVWRRSNPLLFATLAAVIPLSLTWVNPQLGATQAPLIIWAVSSFALGRWLPALRGLPCLTVIALLEPGNMLLYNQGFTPPGVSLVGLFLSFFLAVAVWFVMPYSLGRITRRVAEQKEQLEEQKEQLERQQELIRQQAVREERDRIARDMHDVIAHSVSAMVVQTAAAQDLVRSDLARAEQMLGGVADTGRHALAETGRLLHVLRDEHNELQLEHPPGLANLGALVDEFRASGLHIDIEVPDPLPVLPAAVDASVYRIAQEALTNALKHGQGTVALRLRVTASGLLIQASNPASTRTGTGSGLGLLGMAERVSLLGGNLTHGRTRDGRFVLSATVPAEAS